MTDRIAGVRGNRGYTLLELLVLVLITAILAAIALPAFFGAKDSENDAKIIKNMKAVKSALESYSVDAGGRYPARGDDPAFSTYFEGGIPKMSGGKPGTYPINPYTGVPEAPKLGTVADVAKTRTEAAANLGSPGSIFYTPIAAPVVDVEEADADQVKDGHKKSGKDKDKDKDKTAAGKGKSGKNKTGKDDKTDKTGKDAEGSASDDAAVMVTSYAVQGSSKSGVAEQDAKTGETLVLSNQ